MPGLSKVKVLNRRGPGPSLHAQGTPASKSPRAGWAGGRHAGSTKEFDTQAICPLGPRDLEPGDSGSRLDLLAVLVIPAQTWSRQLNPKPPCRRGHREHGTPEDNSVQQDLEPRRIPTPCPTCTQGRWGRACAFLPQKAQEQGFIISGTHRPTPQTGSVSCWLAFCLQNTLPS